MKNLTNKSIFAGTVFALSLVSTTGQAKVDQAQADKLGGPELTASGAERAGNAAGTIPKFTGGLTKPPACYDGSTWLCDPFAGEKPKFVITASNANQYADNLSEGQLAMFKQYPDSYRIKVYPTHRTSALPERIAKITKQNALNTTLKGDSGLSDYTIQGFPFPIPNNGLEIIWNHVMRWRGDSVERIIGQVTPQANGKYTMVMFRDSYTVRTQLKDYQPGEDENVAYYFKQQVTAPARLAGNVLLVHETIDQVAEPRRAWIYNAGQRRVRRAPQVAYDGPGTAADGLRTSDNFDMYNGSPDRYEWKLIGKKEMYIPYNSYPLEAKGLPYDDIVQPGHINQDLARYELHRVWQVEATLKAGTRHVYAKRVFFIDEDSWHAAVIDHYDGRGNLWRVAEAHLMFYYTGMVMGYAMETLYDLNAKRYIALGLDNNEAKSADFKMDATSSEYTPAALRRSGVR